MPVVTRSAYNMRRSAMDEVKIVEEHCRLEQICAICHDEIRGSDVYHLPCGHTFHKDCLVNQIRIGRAWSTRCAVCRKDHRDAIISNPDLARYLVPEEPNNMEFVMAMMMPLDGGQPPFFVWTPNEGHALFTQMVTRLAYDEWDNNGAVRHNNDTADDTADEADDEQMAIEPEASESSLPDLAAPPDTADEWDEQDEMMNDEDSEGYHFGSRTWSGRLYSMEYPASSGNVILEDEETDTDEPSDATV